MMGIYNVGVGYLEQHYIATTNIYYRQNMVEQFIINVSASTSYNLAVYMRSTQNYSYCYVGYGSNRYPEMSMSVYELETSAS